MRTLVVTLAVAAAGIWAAAAIGIMYLVGAVGDPLVGRLDPPTSSEAWPDGDVPGTDAADLPRFPGSVRIEFTESLQRSSLVTESEYLIDAPLPDVVEHFEAAFRSDAWTVRSAHIVRGEWIYELVSPAGTDTLVEIEPVDRYVEVEVEQREAMAEFAMP